MKGYSVLMALRDDKGQRLRAVIGSEEWAQQENGDITFHDADGREVARLPQSMWISIKNVELAA